MISTLRWILAFAVATSVIVWLALSSSAEMLPSRTVTLSKLDDVLPDAGTAAAAAAAATDTAATTPPPSPPPPVATSHSASNFIIMLSDDLGWADISPPPYADRAMWRTETPRLEQMASEGMTLTGYRNAAPLCSPSRMALITGVFPYRFGVTGIIQKKLQRGALPRVVTIASTLRSAGFVTRHVGKCALSPLSAMTAPSNRLAAITFLSFRAHGREWQN